MSVHVLAVTVDTIGDRHRVTIQIDGQARAVSILDNRRAALKQALAFAADDILDDIATLQLERSRQANEGDPV